MVNLVRALVLLPICLVLVSLATFYVLYGHQSLVSTRRLHRANPALLLAESRELMDCHRQANTTTDAATGVDMDADTPEYAKLPDSIRRIAPVQVRVEDDRLVLTLGVWPRRYAIITRDISEGVADAQKVDAGIWLTQ